MSKPIVAVVGRPNVGKSTLFNKLCGQRLAIVEDTPGITRDRIFAECEWGGHSFLLVDTGGIEPKATEGILAHMREQAQIAIDTADCIIMVVDVRSGLTASDEDVAHMLRRSHKPIILAVNKCDKVGEAPMELYEFYNLGFDEVLPISSVHGHGTGDLLDAVCAHLDFSETVVEEDRIPVAIIGRPNVGKSSLTNALVGEKVAIVSNKAQTTRNRICAIVNRGACQYVFMDTPGLHKARTRLGEYMVGVVKESVADVDAVLLLVEPIPNVGVPEAELIGRIQALGVPAVLVINKIDTVEKEKLLAVMQTYQAAHDFQAILPISARTGEGVEELLDLLAAYLPEGPQLFPEDMVTDQPERQVCAEIIREKLLLCLDKEIPHGTAVELTKFSERIDSGIIDIDATIFCEKASHKGIIIGKNGAMLKKISSLARKDIEVFMGAKVYLETWVKVKENWRDNLNFIHDVGYRCDN